MRHTLDRIFRFAAVGVLFLVSAVLGAGADASAGTITSRYGEVDGVNLHYLSAGHGPAVILLHGYTQTSRMWKPIIPLLAEKFTVIAPDLPGIGDSGIPKDGLDMKTAAIRIHALAKSLGIEKARVVGHDIGLMVAYAYASQFPAETEKLVVMDAFLPGVAGWEDVYNNPGIWHFRFNGPTPEALVRGRERIYFEHFWNDFAADPTKSVSEADRKFYASEYAKPGHMAAGMEVFRAFPEDAEDFAGFAKTGLTMPMLVLSGEKAGGPFLIEQGKMVASNVEGVLVKGSGHWLMEEAPDQVIPKLVEFLNR